MTSFPGNIYNRDVTSDSTSSYTNFQCLFRHAEVTLVENVLHIYTTRLLCGRRTTKCEIPLRLRLLITKRFRQVVGLHSISVYLLWIWALINIFSLILLFSRRSNWLNLRPVLDIDLWTLQSVTIWFCSKGGWNENAHTKCANAVFHVEFNSPKVSLCCQRGIIKYYRLDRFCVCGMRHPTDCVLAAIFDGWHMLK